MRTPRSERLPAEEVLVDNDLISKRSPKGGQLLECLACRWNNVQSKAYGREIVRCTGIKSGVVYPLLRHLEAVGVVSSEFENENPSELGRPKIRHYAPAGTEIGQLFEAAMEAPKHCPIAQLSE